MYILVHYIINNIIVDYFETNCFNFKSSLQQISGLQGFS